MFCQFNLRIRAERIPAWPSFVHYNKRSRLGRHRRQPATLPGWEKWRLRSENRQWKHFFDLAFAYCLAWLCCLVEIVGNCFFYDLVIGIFAYQTPCHPFVALRMGVQCQVSQFISYCRDIGGDCLMGLMTVGWEYRRDEICLTAHDFLGWEISACLGWLLFAGITELG